MPYVSTEKRRAYAREYVQRPHVKACRLAWSRQNKHKQKEYVRTWAEKDPAGRILAVARARAKKYNTEFDLKKEDIIVPEVCPVLGTKLVFNLGKGAGGKPDSLSLDRIDNSKGYVKGNVRVISHLANSMKSTATPEQLKAFASWVLSEVKDG